jgi:hypothetical protein
MRKLATAFKIVTITAAAIFASQAHAFSPVYEIVEDQAKKCGSTIADMRHHPGKYASLRKREEALKIVVDSVAIFKNLEKTLLADKIHRASQEDLKAAALRAEECELAAAQVFSKLQ